MRELFYKEGFSVIKEYKDVNLERFHIKFLVTNEKDIGFVYWTDMCPDIADIFNYERSFQTTAAIEGSYLRVAININLSANSYPKIEDVITRNTISENKRLSILERLFGGNNSDLFRDPIFSMSDLSDNMSLNQIVQAYAPASSGGDMSDYTLMSTTNELETNVVTLTDDLENQIATQANRLTGFETNVIAKIDDLESQVETVDVELQNVNTSFNQNIEDNENQFASMDSKINNVSTSLKQQITDNENQIGSLDAKKNNVTTSLTQQITDNENQIGSLDSKFMNIADGTSRILQDHDGQFVSLGDAIQNVNTTLSQNINNVTESFSRVFQDHTQRLDSADNNIEGNMRVATIPLD